MDVSQCQLLDEEAGESKAAKAARHLFGPPAAPVLGKGLGLDQCRGALGSCKQTMCSSPLRKGGRITASKGPS